MSELGGLPISRGLGSEASHEWERLVVALSVPITGSHFPFPISGSLGGELQGGALVANV